MRPSSFKDYNCCILSLIPSRGCFIVQCCSALISSYCLYHLFSNFLLLVKMTKTRKIKLYRQNNKLSHLFVHLSVINFIYCDISLFVILVLFSPLFLLLLFFHIFMYFTIISVYNSDTCLQ